LIDANGLAIFHLFLYFLYFFIAHRLAVAGLFSYPSSKLGYDVHACVRAFVRTYLLLCAV
jgi:hypothetical protein